MTTFGARKRRKRKTHMYVARIRVVNISTIKVGVKWLTIRKIAYDHCDFKAAFQNRNSL